MLPEDEVLGAVGITEMVVRPGDTSVAIGIGEGSAFYKPLGSATMTYNPLRKMDMDIIPPTEKDNYYRYTKVQGYVHDMGAAMQDGVAGHAGLFANAIDVAKMMQMYLQKGNYGNHQYFSEKTFDEFKSKNKCFSKKRKEFWDSTKAENKVSTHS